METGPPFLPLGTRPRGTRHTPTARQVLHAARMRRNPNTSSSGCVSPCSQGPRESAPPTGGARHLEDTGGRARAGTAARGLQPPEWAVSSTLRTLPCWTGNTDEDLHRFPPNRCATAATRGAPHTGMPLPSTDRAPARHHPIRAGALSSLPAPLAQATAEVCSAHARGGRAPRAVCMERRAPSRGERA